MVINDRPRHSSKKPWKHWTRRMMTIARMIDTNTGVLSGSKSKGLVLSFMQKTG